MTRYWTVVWPNKHPTLDFDIDVWETYSEHDILKEFWPWWSEKMMEKYLHQIVLGLDAGERCIEDWCVVNYAQRNHWRELQDLYT
jgi:hypothetical protein